VVSPTNPHDRCKIKGKENVLFNFHSKIRMQFKLTISNPYSHATILYLKHINHRKNITYAKHTWQMFTVVCILLRVNSLLTVSGFTVGFTDPLGSKYAV
jgi:hypothetical protein